MSRISKDGALLSDCRFLIGDTVGGVVRTRVPELFMMGVDDEEKVEGESKENAVKDVDAHAGVVREKTRAHHQMDDRECDENGFDEDPSLEQWRKSLFGAHHQNDGHDEPEKEENCVQGQDEQFRGRQIQIWFI